MVLTTHDMADVEALCSRIIVIHQGAMMFDGTASGLEARVGVQSALQVVFRSAPDWTQSELPPGVERVPLDGGLGAHIQYDRQRLSPADILTAIRRVGEVQDFRMEEPRLESMMRTLYASTSTGP